LFGVPLGFLVIIVVSLLTPPPAPTVHRMVQDLRYPRD
jgi:cation/acetate symporter